MRFLEKEHIVVQISTCCFVPPGKGTLVHRGRVSHGLALHLSGETRYRFADGQEVLAQANDMIFLPQNSDYQVSTDVRGDCWAINFQLMEVGDFKPFSFHCETPAPYIKAFEQAVQHWERKGEGYRMKCFSALYQILYQLKRDCVVTRAGDPKLTILAPAMQYIQHNYTNRAIRVEHLARECGISQVYLRRLFNECCGTSPLKYINNCRLELAKELLVSQLYSIRDLAELTGYSDECVFSREFKKGTGLSPRAYLAQQQARMED